MNLDPFASSRAAADPAGFEILPPEAPLEMPEQRLDMAPGHHRTITTSPPDMISRRILLILATLVLAVAAGTEIKIALMRDGLELWEGLLLLLFFPLFAWIAFGFCGSAIGFWLKLSGRYVAPFSHKPAVAVPEGRTAILVPVRNEDVEAVFGRIDAMATSLAENGVAQAFEFFVLSDSGVAEGRVERAAVDRLRATSPVPIHYRRRLANTARKPGNIAEWVKRFGGAYDYMLVLDADSLMSGVTMARLAASMDRYPGVGLFQTVPMVAGGQTLFARWQQFASRLYGPIATAGLMWWSGSEATFWGHNAIIRTRAFAESCGLPVLSGREPFGGAIMSHDMVEAALLRRRGWAVHMLVLEDSYEEFPPTLIDFGIRDRRWAQGNLQHLRLLGTGGLHWVNVLQLVIGASAYLTSPLWLILLMVSMAGLFSAGSPDGVILAPSMWILGLTVMLLFGPKLMAAGLALSDPEQCAAFGGRKRLLVSVALEIPLAILMAPATMMTQTLDLIDILRGRPSGWNPQRRETDGIALADALRHYRPHLLLGLIFAALALVSSGNALWTLPVTFGLFSAPFLASWSSRRGVGTAARRRGLFLVPGETAEPLRLASPRGPRRDPLPAR